MFSIFVEDVFQITNRKGLTLIGRVSGTIKIGDYLACADDRSKKFRVIGVECLNFLSKEKNFSHNPAVIIDVSNVDITEFKNRTFEIIDIL